MRTPQRISPSRFRSRNSDVAGKEKAVKKDSVAVALLKSVNESSKAVRPLFVGFLAVMAYVVVIVAGIQDVDFLVGLGAKLPIIDTQVPFKAFFAFTPVLLVVYHFQILIQLSILGRTAARFRRRIDRVEKDKSRLALETDSFMLSYFVAGPEKGAFNSLLVIPLIITLIVAPPFLLGYLQAAFLPYQSEPVTWWHRFWLLIDLSLIIYLVPRTFDGTPEFSGVMPAAAKLRCRRKYRGMVRLLISLLVVPLVGFSFFSALIPGEHLENFLVGKSNATLNQAIELPLTRLLFFPLGSEQKRKSAENCLDRSEFRFFHRNIDVCRRVIVKHFAKPDKHGDLMSYDPSALPAVEGVTLVSRNLRFANFFSSRLPLANLSESDLRGASFVDADLRFTSFSGANLKDAKFSGALLIGATLNSNISGIGDLTAIHRT